MSLATSDESLDKLLRGTPYLGYCYSYPHKTAYRTLAPQSLCDVWHDERLDSLFLYVHLPFCEMRCGFCNLFTLSQPKRNLPERYLAAIHRQASSVASELGARIPRDGPRFSRLAFGGGTPTFLSLQQWRQLGATLTSVLGVEPQSIPVSCEASPATIDPWTEPGKLAWLRSWGVSRISLGVQSWSEADVHAMGRPQQSAQVLRALDAIREAGFPVLNLDLIYGGDGQTIDSWLHSVERALAYKPEELYLYPLYVRPLTGLGRRGKSWDDCRLEAYRAARELLVGRGYLQYSLRMFRAPLAATGASGLECPEYRCQEDGMVGLGCGARSYTRKLHYCTPYAVGQAGIRRLINQFVESTSDDLAQVRHGYALDEDEQRRRYLIISLLPAEGLSRLDYTRRFGNGPEQDWPQLESLESRGLAARRGDRWQLTARGIEWSDVIGPWLYSLA